MRLAGRGERLDKGMEREAWDEDAKGAAMRAS